MFQRVSGFRLEDDMLGALQLTALGLATIEKTTSK